VIRVVFLDRDGVINELVERDGKLVSPRKYSDFVLCAGVPDAISTLSSSGFKVVVVSNQPDISRRMMDQSELDQMNLKLLSIGVHKIIICPHSDEHMCNCRKPKPGMLKNYLMSQAEEASRLWMVGDSESDISAGLLVGAKTIFISNKRSTSSITAHFVADTLLDATSIINQDMREPHLVLSQCDQK
jgi:D-glycero-D-manno-heptose 1,7-bisphosphate phosphatase